MASGGFNLKQIKTISYDFLMKGLLVLKCRRGKHSEIVRHFNLTSVGKVTPSC